MAEQRVQKRLAVICAADVAAYLQLMDEDEVGHAGRADCAPQGADQSFHR